MVNILELAKTVVLDFRMKLAEAVTESAKTVIKTLNQKTLKLSLKLKLAKTIRLHNYVNL